MWRATASRSRTWTRWPRAGLSQGPAGARRDRLRRQRDRAAGGHTRPAVTSTTSRRSCTSFTAGTIEFGSGTVQPQAGPGRHRAGRRLHRAPDQERRRRGRAVRDRRRQGRLRRSRRPAARGRDQPRAARATGGRQRWGAARGVRRGAPLPCSRGRLVRDARAPGGSLARARRPLPARSSRASPWNQRVDKLPVHAQLRRDRAQHRRSATTCTPTSAPGRYEGAPIGIPFTTVSRAPAQACAVSFDYADESDRGPYPIPRERADRGRPRLGRRPARDRGRPRRAAGSTSCSPPTRATAARAGSAGSGAIWNLRSNRLRPRGWTSADAAGLPILPGLARYDEVKRGRDRPRAALHRRRARARRSSTRRATSPRPRRTRRCRRWASACG